MYDTARRVTLVKQRVRENTRRRQRCGIYGLSAACMLLCAVLMQAAITALCFRLRIRENQKKDGADNTEPQKQEGKTS